MSLVDAFKLVATVLASIGGGGAIVLGLSAWLGKLWADRMMQSDKEAHETALEGLRNEFASRLAADAAEHARRSETHEQVLRERLALYKEAIPPVVDVLIRIYAMDRPLRPDEIIDFERERLRTTALIGLMSDAKVFHAYNALVDYVWDCNEGKKNLEFNRFREFGLNLVSEMRRDIGLHNDALKYEGHRP